jgi:hypothetical protein
MKVSPSEAGIDQMLRSYFRRETPTRWPVAPSGEITVAASQGKSLASSRVLVGMSLVVLVAVYLGLAAFFPRDNSAGLDPHRHPNIANRPGVGPNKPNVEPRP